MATMVGKQANVADLVKQLVELDWDAIEAYEAAIARLKEATNRTQMEAFRADHERHVEELSDVLRAMGIEPPSGPDAKRVLTKGKVVFGALLGDETILVAMKTNEDDTNTAYERAVARADLPPRLREIVRRGLDDERRHRGWILQRLSPPLYTGTNLTPTH